MVARTWRGETEAAKADEYLEYLKGTGLKEYNETEGNRGVFVLRRIEGDRAEWVTLTLWDSIEAVKGFAGEDIEKAVFYPEDDRFLTDRDTTATHFDVVFEESK